MHNLLGQWGTQMSGMAGMNGVGMSLGAQQAAAMGSLQGHIGLGYGATIPLTFKQEMQRDVNTWLKDWDK